MESPAGAAPPLLTKKKKASSWGYFPSLFQENGQLSFEMTAGKGFKGYIETWLIEPISQGCRFTFINSCELPYGIIGRIIEPLSRRRAEGTVDEMLKRLKQLVEEKK